MITVLAQILATLVALIPVVATNVVVAVDARRHPVPTETIAQIAYREGRQCFNGVGGTVWSPPERCAYTQDHYGPCES